MIADFWGDAITHNLNAELSTSKSKVVINLASVEYFSSIKTKLLSAEIITPIFKDEKNGKFKIISFFAKKARGMMSAYIIQNRITDPERIKQFTVGGYGFDQSQSGERDWVFTRENSTL